MIDGVERRHRRAAGDTQELLRAYRRAGDTEARDELVRRYLPLVRALARRHAYCGERLDDLVQVGSLALVVAIDRYDPDRGGSLATFAIPTITGYIRNHLRDRASCVRVPRRLAELSARVRLSRETLSDSLSRAPTVAELARDAGVGHDDVVRALETEQVRDPLPLGPDARLGEPSAGVEADAFAACDDRLLLAAGFRALGERERRILHLRFFVGLSQAEIAREVGLSQVHVSRLIRSSLARMRAALETDRVEENDATAVGDR